MASETPRTATDHPHDHLVDYEFRGDFEGETFTGTTTFGYQWDREKVFGDGTGWMPPEHVVTKCRCTCGHEFDDADRPFIAARNHILREVTGGLPWEEDMDGERQ
jgi:hypothetical protein